MRSDRVNPARHRKMRVTAGAVCALLFASAAWAMPVIDRVLAVVQGSIVTLSDVNAALALGLVNTAGAADPVGSALEQLIERSLQLVEVERYAPPEPAPDAIDARVALIRRRFAGEAEFEQMLRVTGLTVERLRAIARDDLRLQAYLDQRFASFSEPSEDDVRQYYRERQQEFVRDGVQQPLTAVAADVRRRLQAERRATLIDEWSRQLRLRADVLVIPRT
jgi:parvulin-like peptidyl-prolyl isomerase